jgi:vitamin B12 transporter
MLLAALCSSYTFAQDTSSSKRLEEITVTANKFPTKTSQTGKVLTIVTRQQLERAGGKDLSQILHEQAGLYLNGAYSNLGKDKTIFLRGAKGEHTLIAIDGVPVYDPSGVTSSFDIRSIPIDNVERIEILKGSQSTLYGSDAIAGVINIIMKKGSKKPSPSMLLNYGSYRTLKANAAITGKSGIIDYQAGYTYLKSKGFSEAQQSTSTGSFDDDASKQHAFMAGIGITPSEHIRIHPYLRISRFEAALDNGAFSDDKDYMQTLNNFQAGVRNEFNFNNIKLNILYNYNRVKRTYLNDSVKKETPLDGYLKGFYQGSEHFADAFVSVPLSPAFNLVAGAEFRASDTRIETAGMYKYEFGGVVYSGNYETRLGNDSAKQNQKSIYGALVYKSDNGFNAELGGRWNHHSSYGSNNVFNFNPSYLINRQVKIFANISSAYRVPTLYQLYSEYRNTTTTLKPEKAITYEAGFQFMHTKNIVNLRVALFKRNVTDGIAFYTEPLTYKSYYINQDKQKDHGFEIEPSVNIGQKASINLFYSYVDGKITTRNGGKDTSYFNLIRRPKQTLGATISYQVTAKFSMTGSIKNFGKRPEINFFSGETITLPAYTLLDLYTEYQFIRQLKIFVQGRNLANVSYSEVLGYNTMGRNYTAGIMFKL